MGEGGVNEEPIITDGLPDGWTFHTTQIGDRVTYEVRTEHRYLIMSSTWDRDGYVEGLESDDVR